MSLAAALDELAAAVFGGAAGRRRIEPLLKVWDEQVGPLREEDPEHATWQAIRTDWALCDVALCRPGDTWAWRAAQGAIAGADVDEAAAAVLARSIAGLWFVTPGRRLWLCDAMSGVGVQLDPGVKLLDVPEGRTRPAAVWEARVALVDGAAQLCRPPLSYPVQVADEVRRRGLARLVDPTAARHDALMSLRRHWLHWGRAPRADAALLFAGGRRR